MSQTHATKKPEATATSTAKDVVSKLSEQAAKALNKQAIDVGKKQLDKVRDLIVERPFEAVGVALGIGVLLRSWLRGPTTTLLLMGGAAYLGTRYQQQQKA